MRHFLCAPVSLLFIVLTFACGGSQSESSNRHFTQDFDSPVGAVAVEVNNQPKIIATAYLINRQEGYFITADHFVDAPRLLQTNEFKLFVNGRAYNATPIKVFQLYDLTVIHIKDDFNPQDLSEPFELTDDTVAIGDTVYAKGVHPHPAFLQEKNKKQGRSGKVVRIMRDYYGKYLSADSLVDNEFVYDNLKAVVSAVNQKTKINYGSSGAVTPRIQKARRQSNSYFYIDTEYNHSISFGGLSGGPVVNEHNKLVGIITAEQPGTQRKGGKTIQTYNRLTVTYIDLVRDEISRYFEH